MIALTHRRAVATMLVVTLLWSIAGVVSRHLDAARSFEVTFWRSAANGVALALLLAAWRGPSALWRSVRDGGRTMVFSALCWCVLFTAFMLALTMTTVANVLITMALAPVFTALISRFVMHQHLPLRTWIAVLLAGIGIAWMYGSQVGGGSLADLYGTLVALTVPIGGATMWTLAQHNARAHPDDRRDMTPAVLMGTTLSALLMLPLAWPLQASAHDIGLLTMLGVVQLAIPCVLAVAVGAVLKAPEASLLGLLEILFGVAWTWLGSDESPTPAVIGGGSLVLLALAGNEALALWGSRDEPAEPTQPAAPLQA
ncbi:DMT family transporter [Leptothrix discophora]|uniref:EamA family transporter n=1 Tax=Leptothrix discophora TaxID=89 RepID=A0ABT9G2L3_LEPDI|nr:EamA family transporter [Leptothrix discophora]MDP4300721.1 EamA family transporter [Leptothrix discophora]